MIPLLPHRVPEAIRLCHTRNKFKKLFYQLNYRGGTGVELGVLYGHFSQRTFARSVLENYVGVDLFMRYGGYGKSYKSDADFRKARTVAQQVYTSIGADLRIQDTVEAALYFEDESVEFVYVDANHNDPFVWNDIQAWWRKVKPGGILAGHDYRLPGFPGVVSAVNRLVHELQAPLHITQDDKFPSWIVYKPHPKYYV